MKIARSIGALVQHGLKAVLGPAQPDKPERVELETRAPSETDTRSAQELKLLELLAEDFSAYDGRLSEPGLWAVVAHRLGSHGAASTDSLLANAMLGAAQKALSAGLATGVDLVWGIELPQSVQLGRRVRLWHNGCMRLHAKAIGNDVHIRHDTTLGPLRARDGDSEEEQLPTIEDRVDLGSGVCVLGNVRVGHDAMVGANSLVIKNVPPKVTAMGVPARILPS